MTQTEQEFTLVAIYHHNRQRFTEMAKGGCVTEALIAMMNGLHKDHETFASEFAIVGVFAGHHQPKDCALMYADVRPEGPLEPEGLEKPFTVVSDAGVHCVMATDAAAAELKADEDECLDVGSVFEGHLVEISPQVDWDRFFASIPKSELDEDDDEET